MKRCVIEVVGPLAVLAIAMLALEAAYADCQSWIDLRFATLAERKADTRILMVGNSHVGALGEPSLAGPNGVFNAAIGGLDLFHMAAIVEKAVQLSPGLELVLLGLDYELLGYNLIVGNERWKDRLLFKHVGRLYEDTRVNRLKAASSFFRANRNLSCLLDGRGEGAGLGSEAMSRPILGKACEQRAWEHSAIKFEKDLADENLLHLRQALAFVRDSDVRLVAVNLPKRSCYVAAYEQEAADLARRSFAFLPGEGVAFLDWFEHPAFDDEDFVDADHLGPSGVAKVVALLRRELTNSSDAVN